MIIVYVPEDGEERRWDLKTARITAVEAEAVERATGLEWEQAKAKVLNGSMLATRAVAWVLLKRDQPTLRYVQFVPAANELGYDLDAEEMAAIREGIENNPDLDEDERAAALAQLDAASTATDEQPADGADADPETVPKDPAVAASPVAV
ncbi:hypothetical protein [Streptomyces cucumeris]|uniref:hypothetical protein n=1 Tax=Streptomyces cucumeris TaxID=2962890 RepID=UPI0020C8BE8A|nr:hypothetical protein [Streptomyces sp. NEAU-Y11]MCP9209280.1 hypothetical protein [Streptomyces sp. NEAU-Y11]